MWVWVFPEEAENDGIVWVGILQLAGEKKKERKKRRSKREWVISLPPAEALVEDRELFIFLKTERSRGGRSEKGCLCS